MTVLRGLSLLALVVAGPWLVNATDWCGDGCEQCNNFNWAECTECSHGSKKDGVGPGICYHHSCHWTQEDEDNFGEKLMAGTIAGIIIGTICVIVVSLPVCCGVMKESSSGSLKIIGVVVGIVSGVCIAIPAITGSVTGNQAIDDFCDRCDTGCSDEERQEAKDMVAGLGVIFAYTVAFGFVVVVLAIVAISLSCCMCCPCCGPLQEAQQAKQQGGAPAAQVVGQVVGQPQNNCS
jgi:diacylglycerol kinase